MLKTFKTWIISLTESSNSTYEYGCAMLFYDLPELINLHRRILPEDVYMEDGDNTYGLEDQPHTTLLYGFHNNVDPNEVLKDCAAFTYSQLPKLHNVSCFNNEKYDVLKFDVDSSLLHSVNEALTKKYRDRYTTNFPDYHPHCTIAYIKKDRGNYYANLFKNLQYSVTPKKLVYSMPSGEKLEKKL